MPQLKITKTQMARAKQQAIAALDRARASGSVEMLEQISRQAHAAVTAAASESRSGEPPVKLMRRHDLIAWYLRQGLSESEVLERLRKRGFRLKLADVRANARHALGQRGLL